MIQCKTLDDWLLNKSFLLKKPQRTNESLNEGTNINCAVNMDVKKRVNNLLLIRWSKNDWQGAAQKKNIEGVRRRHAAIN